MRSEAERICFYTHGDHRADVVAWIEERLRAVAQAAMDADREQSVAQCEAMADTCRAIAARHTKRQDYAVADVWLAKAETAGMLGDAIRSRPSAQPAAGNGGGE